MNFPCHQCIVLAICNATMHQHEDYTGQNAINVYHRCTLIKEYVDKYYVKRVDKNTWKTSLKSIHEFFVGGYPHSYHKDIHIITDHIPAD